MFRNRENFDNGNEGLSDVWKVIIVIACAIITTFAANKIIEWGERQDMELQYQNEYVVEK